MYLERRTHSLTKVSIAPFPDVPGLVHAASCVLLICIHVLGNPLRLVDPSGHGQCDADGNCQSQPYTPPPPPQGVELGTIYASPYLQEFLEYMGISENSFKIMVHTDNAASNSNLYRYEIGAWVLIQEQANFHPLSYAAGTEEAEYFSVRGLYFSAALLQVIHSREEYYSPSKGIDDLFEWIQQNKQSGQFAYPKGDGKIPNQAIYNDFLILAYLVEQGVLPDFLASYPDTPTEDNPSGKAIFYGHYDLVDGIGQYFGRDSLSVSSWAWAQVDWVPSLNDFYTMTGNTTAQGNFCSPTIEIGC